MKCRICSNITGNISFVAREMMYGMRDQFEYFVCSVCGCVQIKDYPKDLSKYYPSDYYSFHPAEIKGDNVVIEWARRRRAIYGLSRKYLIGKLIAKIKPLPNYYKILRKCNLNLDSKILEIGCGYGLLLRQMHREGFRNLFGIDAYLPPDRIEKGRRLQILKYELNEFYLSHRNEFNLVMLHHSLEHMLDHYKVFQILFDLVKKDGYMWITMPVVGYAWRHYGVNWCGLDAPRHLIIHSKESFALLCSKYDFEITEMVCDSTEYQFIASEQYENDIPLLDRRSYIVDPMNSIFTCEQLKNFTKKAQKLNESLDGDSVSFLMRRNVKQH
jgi:SAM-dependent methyltransferase